MIRFALTVFGLVALSCPAHADWTAATDNQDAVVNAHARAMDGSTILHASCNRNLGPGISVSLENYRGNALERLDDVKRPVSLRVAQPDGPKDFPAHAHYVAADREWVVSNPDLPATFADALGHGTLLTVSNARGEKVADFDLKGADKAAELMRGVCRR